MSAQRATGYFNAAEFEAKPERRWSMEWDFGVMWTELDGMNPAERAWPLWRVSWIIDTGELYAISGNDVIVLGNVPAVGDYPHGGGDSWEDYKNAQAIERVMAGWAEGPPHKPLSWIETRLKALARGEL